MAAADQALTHCLTGDVLDRDLSEPACRPFERLGEDLSGAGESHCGHAGSVVEGPRLEHHVANQEENHQSGANPVHSAPQPNHELAPGDQVDAAERGQVLTVLRRAHACDSSVTRCRNSSLRLGTSRRNSRTGPVASAVRSAT